MKLKTIKTSALVTGDTVRSIRKLLYRIDKHEITDFAIIFTDRDGCTDWHYDSRDGIRMIGHLEMMKQGIIKSKEPR